VHYSSSLSITFLLRKEPLNLLFILSCLFAASSRAEEEAARMQREEQSAQEDRRKELELDAVRQEVARRKAEEKARLDRLAKSAQVGFCDYWNERVFCVS